MIPLVVITVAVTSTVGWFSEVVPYTGGAVGVVVLTGDAVCPVELNG